MSVGLKHDVFMTLELLDRDDSTSFLTVFEHGLSSVQSQMPMLIIRVRYDLSEILRITLPDPGVVIRSKALDHSCD